MSQSSSTSYSISLDKSTQAHSDVPIAQLPPYHIWQVPQSHGAGSAPFGIRAHEQTFGGVYTKLGLGTEMLIYNLTARMAALQSQ